MPDSLEKPERADLLAQPLDFIVAEHRRQTELCARLDTLADKLESAPVQAEAAALAQHLRHDLALHTLDEERDLFPLLRQRCLAQDGVAAILDRLEAEHELDQDLVEFLAADLEVLANGHRLANPLRLLTNARAFAETQRRHLAWENSTVIPLARSRLTADDLAVMGRAFAARRDGAVRA